MDPPCKALSWGPTPLGILMAPLAGPYPSALRRPHSSHLKMEHHLTEEKAPRRRGWQSSICPTDTGMGCTKSPKIATQLAERWREALLQCVHLTIQ